MTPERYLGLSHAIGLHDAAMLVKWLLGPPTKGYLQRSVAPIAYKLGLFTTTGLTGEGRAFAVQHMRTFLAKIDNTEVPCVD